MKEKMILDEFQIILLDTYKYIYIYIYIYGFYLGRLHGFQHYKILETDEFLLVLIIAHSTYTMMAGQYQNINNIIEMFCKRLNFRSPKLSFKHNSGNSCPLKHCMQAYTQIHTCIHAEPFRLGQINPSQNQMSLIPIISVPTQTVPGQ